jgi:imidazolonepropionase-like amidohydrolase
MNSRISRWLALIALTLTAAGCAHPSLRVTADRNVALAHAPYAPDSGTIAIHCGTLIDGVSPAPRHDVTVVIRDGRVSSVQSLVQIAATMPFLELGDYTCLPGLIDMHTHITDRAPDGADLSVYFRRSADETQTISAENAAVTLQAGFTSVRNVGTYLAWSERTIRDAINRGEVAGPRMQICGYYLTIPHGGGDLYVPGYQEPPDSARFHAGVAHDPDEFRRKAQEAVDGGADLLKVIASGAVLAFGGIPGAREMQPEDIAAVVQVAHAAGIKVAAHAHGAQSIKDAILAGVDTVEHASYVNDEDIRLALEHHVALSMDVYNGDYIDTEGRRQRWPEEFLRKNVETTEVQRQGFTKAHAAGVAIVYGTDAAVYPHGLNARQFPIMVARGMTPMEAIQSATSVAARYMGWSDRIGEIAPGRFGDVIAVKGDPLKDITRLQDVAVVIKGGLAFKLPRN